MHIPYVEHRDRETERERECPQTSRCPHNKYPPDKENKSKAPGFMRMCQPEHTILSHMSSDPTFANV